LTELKRVAKKGFSVAVTKFHFKNIGYKFLRHEKESLLKEERCSGLKFNSATAEV